MLKTINKNYTLNTAIMVLIFALHVPLALFIKEYSLFGKLYAFIIILFGFYAVLLDRSYYRVIAIILYIAGAEVLWRMTQSGLFWEFGKYAISFLLFFAILRWNRPIQPLPLLYFAALLPSVVLTLFDAPSGSARGEISSTLSGPLVLSLAIIFFTGIKISRDEFLSHLKYALAPIIGIGALTVSSIYRAELIQFQTSSNFIASSGFGPNQVSTALGLGALFAWFVFLKKKKVRRLSLLYIGIFVWLLTQAILTFSRGGVYSCLIAIVPVTIFYLRNLKYRTTIIFGFVTALILFLYFIIPRLNEFTSGYFEKRYADMDTSNRLTLLETEWKSFLDNPIAGVGPGMVGRYHAQVIGVESASHTEFTRMLAEHGLFGAIALLILLMIFINAWKKCATAEAKALFFSLTLWSVSVMLHSAMRIASIPLIFGLAFSNFLNDASKPIIPKEQLLPPKNIK